MKPLTPAQQRVVDVMKRLAFLVVYAAYLITCFVIISTLLPVSLIVGMFYWIVTGKDGIELAFDIVFYPVIFPYWLFGYK